MSDLVDGLEIERIVGVKRHLRAHFARAVSKEQRVYILHSQVCLEDNKDLRNCEFSLALDKGIDESQWVLDRPVPVKIVNGRLTCAMLG